MNMIIWMIICREDIMKHLRGRRQQSMMMRLKWWLRNILLTFKTLNSTLPNRTLLIRMRKGTWIRWLIKWWVMKCKSRIKRINCFKSWGGANRWNNSGYKIIKKPNANRLYKNSKRGSSTRPFVQLES